MLFIIHELGWHCEISPHDGSASSAMTALERLIIVLKFGTWVNVGLVDLAHVVPHGEAWLSLSGGQHVVDVRERASAGARGVHDLNLRLDAQEHFEVEALGLFLGKALAAP